MTLMLNLAKKIIKALRSRNDDGGLNKFRASSDASRLIDEMKAARSLEPRGQ